MDSISERTTSHLTNKQYYLEHFRSNRGHSHWSFLYVTNFLSWINLILLLLDMLISHVMPIKSVTFYLLKIFPLTWFELATSMVKRIFPFHDLQLITLYLNFTKTFCWEISSLNTFASININSIYSCSLFPQLIIA